MTGVIALTDHPAAARLNLALVHFVWQGAALAFIAIVLLVVLRKASAGVRYAALLVVFAAMAAWPVVTFALTGDAPAPVATAAVETVAREQVAPSPPPVADTEPPPVSVGLEPESETSHAAPAPDAPDPWLVRSGDWVGARLPWITLLWLTGVVVLSLRLLTRWWAVGRVRGVLESASADWQYRLRSLAQRLRMRRPVRLLTSAAGRVPMVIGWLRPVIVMPTSALTGLTPEQLAAILTHELAHVRRHDHLLNVAQTVVEILLFYHPAVWWVSSAIRAERENCCDDVAVRVSGDVVGYMRALAWVEQNRAGVPEAAIASSGTSLLSRIRRLAGAVNLPAAGYSWVAAAMALGVATVLPIAATVSGLAAPPDSGHHGLGAREQWQPQTESDPRLQQPVHFEVLGRAAVPVLGMLSEQSGVSLAVAPEDLETVGERKLTIIAQGCTLKSIMAQIPNALQECHWDIDPSGPEPVYLLHRNAGTDLTMAELVDKDSTRWQEEGRPAREARLEEARRALAMSPQDLDELAKTDPFLAASVKDPETRKRLELLLTLPKKDMQEFIATGRAYLEYSTAPEPLRQAAQESAEAYLKEAAASGDSVSLACAELLHDSLPEVGICFEDYADDGISLLLQCYDRKGEFVRKGMGEMMHLGDCLRAGGGTALPPRLPDDHFAKYWYRPLLLKTGYNEKTADVVLAELARQRDEQAQEERDRKRALEWREPQSPALHRTITLPFSPEEPVAPVEVQRFIAHETGLSLISDYFIRRPSNLPEEALATMPVWRLLYLLGDHWFMGRYDWNEAGDCVVFHARDWYRLALQEFPESLAQVCREKLEKQGGFTLDDAASIAAALAERGIPPAALRARGYDVNVPPDLSEAGLSGHALASEALLLYASLSPEQRAKARSAAGLPYAEMTGAQQALMRPYAFFTGGWNNDRHPIPEEETAKAVYRIKQSSREVGSEIRQMFELRVEFPSLQEGTVVGLLPPKPGGGPALAGQE